MAAYNIWGNAGNAAYAVPMVRLAPVDPLTQQVLGWNPTENALDYLPFGIDPSTGNVAVVGSLNIPLAQTYRVNGIRVVGARIIGWSVASGTATRTSFATSTVTLPELAARVKALLDDLTTHGLIGS